MPMPKEMKNRLCEELEKQVDEVRQCSMAPGSLEKILIRAGDKMARLVEQELADTASKEADFPPSGLSPLRREAPLQPTEAKADDHDDKE